MTEAQAYKETINCVRNRNEVLKLKFEDPATELRFLRAHIEGNHIILSNIIDKYTPKEDVEVAG